MNFQEKIDSLETKIREALSPLISSHCILLDLPYYTNIGDVLIWEGTESFLDSIGCKCLYKTSIDSYEYRKVSSDVTILLQGGGNFGDIWRKHQDFRLKVIEDYSENSIIILPQTIYYEDKSVMKRDAELMRMHKKLTICGRDANSYQLLKDYFCDNSILLLPDMAFCISQNSLVKYRRPEKDKILFLRRTDKEFNLQTSIVLSEDVDIRDWPSMEKISYTTSFYYKICKLNSLLSNSLNCFVDFYAHKVLKPHFMKVGVAFVSSYKNVYTTRLHVAILSVLLHKSFIFIDNSYGKNSSFYKAWLSDLDNVKFFQK